MLDYQSLSPGTREQVDRLVRSKGLTINQAVEEVVIEGISMGGLTFAMRKKATLMQIKGPPQNEGQKGDKDDPN